MLLGNHNVFHKSPGRFLAGSTLSDVRSAFNKNGMDRNKFLGFISGSQKSSVPVGYQPGSAWTVPQQSGGIGSTKQIIGSSSITFSNLAGGYNLNSSVTGAGDISNANMLWLILAIGDLVGSSNVVSDVNSVGIISGDLITSGTLSGSLDAAINGASGISGFADISGIIIGGIFSSADLFASGTLAPDLSAIADLTSGLLGEISLTASTTSIWAMVGAIAAASTILADADGHAFLDSTLSGNMSAGFEISATAAGNSAITVTGDLLSTANVADSVWGALFENNISYQDAIKILVAIAAGKTTVVNLGGGDATVTFRTLDDSANRIVATMHNSDRTNLTFNLD